MWLRKKVTSESRGYAPFCFVVCSVRLFGSRDTHMTVTSDYSMVKNVDACFDRGGGGGRSTVCSGKTLQSKQSRG